MITNYHPELNEQPQQNTQITIKPSTSGKFRLHTALTLTGCGIRFSHKRGNVNIYYATAKALHRLAERHEIGSENWFD